MWPDLASPSGWLVLRVNGSVELKKGTFSSKLKCIAN